MSANDAAVPATKTGSKSASNSGSLKLTVKELLAGVQSPYVDQRERAMQAVREMGPEDVEALVAYIQKRTKAFHTRRRAYNLLATCVLTVAIPLIFYCMYRAILAGLQGHPSGMGGWLGGGIGGVGGGLIGGLLGGLSFLLFPPQDLRAAGALLAEFDDVRVTGLLVQSLDMKAMSTPEFRYAAGNGLRRLLTRITPENAEVLALEHRTALARYVRNGQPLVERSLLLAMLQALGVAGGAEALPHLRETARRGSDATWREVAGAAEEAARQIEARIERERTGEALLRPTRAPDSADALYLRPAQGAAPAETANLLRAADSGSDTV